jgi:hypothetical protein
MTTRDELWAAVHRRKAEHAAGQPITPAPWERNRCTACGQFLRKGSTYVNRCSDCWTPEDEFR